MGSLFLGWQNQRYLVWFFKDTYFHFPLGTGGDYQKFWVDRFVLRNPYVWVLHLIDWRLTDWGWSLEFNKISSCTYFRPWTWDVAIQQMETNFCFYVRRWLAVYYSNSSLVFWKVKIETLIHRYRQRQMTEMVGETERLSKRETEREIWGHHFEVPLAGFPSYRRKCYIRSMGM